MLIDAGKTKLSVRVKVTLATQWFERFAVRGTQSQLCAAFRALARPYLPTGEGSVGHKQALEKLFISLNEALRAKEREASLSAKQLF